MEVSYSTYCEILIILWNKIIIDWNCEVNSPAKKMDQWTKMKITADCNVTLVRFIIILNSICIFIRTVRVKIEYQ